MTDANTRRADLPPATSELPERLADLIAIGQRAAGVAHDVNNTATYVLANLQVMERTLQQVVTAARSGSLDGAAIASLAEQTRALTRENIGGLDRIVAVVRELRHFSSVGSNRDDLSARRASEPEPPATPVTTTPSSGAPETPRRARLLIIDDEPALLTAFERLLRGEYDVTLAASGFEAVERLQHDRDWDVILCDVMMPGMDGTAVHEWIQRHVPALEPRVLFCTGGAFTPRGIRLSERFTDRVLAKPFTVTALRQLVADRVRRSSAG